MVLQILGISYPEHIKVLHFNFLSSSSVPNPVTDPSNLTEAEKAAVYRRDEWSKTGTGYFVEQSTKPFTIGLAIASTPIAILAWIGEKIYAVSDPRVFDIQHILDAVAMYWLTGTFSSSVIIYNQVRL